MKGVCVGLGFLLLLAGFPRCRSGNVTEYGVLVMLPLSGQWEARGRAQREGIRAAERERKGVFTGVSYVDVQLEYIDTKCDPHIESSEVLSRLLRRDRRLVVLGGNCDDGRTEQKSVFRPDSLAGLRSFVPQATFEDILTSGEGSMFLHSISTRPSMTSVNAAMLAFIRQRGWRDVAIIHGTDIRHAQMVTSLGVLADEQQVNISLRTEWNGDSTLVSLRDIRVRPVVLYMTSSLSAEVICRANRKLGDRFVWLVFSRDRLEFSRVLSDGCDGGDLRGSIVLFEVPTVNTSEVKEFETVIGKSGESSSWRFPYETGLAYDTAGLLLDALHELLLRDDYDRAALQATFTANLSSLLRQSDTYGVTGRMRFKQEGMRQLPIGIYFLQGLRMSRIGVFGPAHDTKSWVPHANVSLGPGTISVAVRLDGTPLSLFIVLCALALVGAIYTAAILAFNIAKRTEKIVKMTSPNINVVVLSGVISAYACMPLLALDSGQVTLDVLATIFQVSVFLLSISFTVIYGAIFAKSWRVYMIFKNLAVDGKMTRDEHLLFGVIMLVLLDLTILLPWTIADPIRCERIASTVLTQQYNYTDVSVYVDSCTSRHLAVWAGLLYAYKTCILLAGLYFTWQTRHVTLPSLNDTKRQYIVIYNVIAMATLALPVLFSRCTVGGAAICGVAGLAIWFALVVTVTLMFVPKIWLLRRERKEALVADSTQFLFSESMRKTREAVRKCGMCFCLTTGEDNEDKYAEEVLTTEIETLKRTVKEKDATIRELTDRLYFGSEKFQEYLHSPRHRNSMLCEVQRRYARRTVSQPLQTRNSEIFRDDRRAMHNSFGGTEHRRTEPLATGSGTDNSDDTSFRVSPPQQQLSAKDLATMNRHLFDGISDNRSRSAVLVSSPWSMRAQTTPKRYDNLQPLATIRSSSPPQDSAIDNTSPSTDGSDRDIDNDASRQRQPLTCSKRRRASSSGFVGSAHDLITSSIDLAAMECDAKVGQWTERQAEYTNNAYNKHPTNPRRFTQSYYGRSKDAVAVSEL